MGCCVQAEAGRAGKRALRVEGQAGRPNRHRQSDGPGNRAQLLLRETLLTARNSPRTVRSLLTIEHTQFSKDGSAAAEDKLRGELTPSGTAALIRLLKRVAELEI